MNGNEELLTIAKYWQSWANGNMIICVLNNRDLNMVTWEQRMMEGDPKLDTTQVIPDFNYAAYAKTLGFLSFRLQSPGEVVEAWHQALAADRPVLLEAITDPDVSPFPDHVLMKNSEQLAASLSKGDHAAVKHTGHILQQKLEQELKNGRR